ncbi:DUF447 family protein [Roseiconus nitratireducens]|uniref:DUF447 family protein n=1 Tax=Roseiconus nitratireducens TaxID=2605748 RepID=A0A5M6DAC1_9BACT|nr:DUF447 domain-containing protein [Roseiconus nitratireducens]KAA5544323.1 DUF447 family protein [Roseiconus nitratireducens]
MIIESIVTTVGPEGQVNVAPMGPLVGDPSALRVAGPCDPQFLLRPFAGSRTFENLKRSRRATIHLTDDVGLFARAAVTSVDATADQIRWLEEDRWAVLKDCHRWFAVEVLTIGGQSPRYEMSCRVLHGDVVRPFCGFNRAKHAVVEAAILATRTHLINANELATQLRQLTMLVDKTAGQEEREAFEMLRREINRRSEAKLRGGTV